MKILFISSFLLFNETCFGGSKRLYYFAKALNENHDLSIIMLDACKEFNVYKTKKNPFSDTVVFIEDTIRNAVYRRLYLSWDMSLYVKKHKKKLGSFLAKNSYDAVFIAFPPALSLVRVLPKRLLRNVSYLEDDLLIPGTIGAFKKLHSPIRKIISFVRILQIKSLYHRTLKSITNVLFISKQEKEIGRKYFPGLKAHLVPYGIDVKDYTFISTKKIIPVIGFIGNYLHIPNKDAVEHFFADLFPTVFSVIPQIKVHIAGKNMPDRWLASNSFSNSITYLSEVHDLNAFYREIDIFINPIVSGRGLRTKLIEAAASGVPIVSTMLGAEGLEDLKIEIAENGLDFTDKIQMLCSNKSLYSDIAKFNRARVENNYSIDIIGKNLASILQG